MRVPIENGSGFFNQVSILLSSLPLCGTYLKLLISESQIVRQLFLHHHRMQWYILGSWQAADLVMIFGLHLVVMQHCKVKHKKSISSIIHLATTCIFSLMHPGKF